MTFVLVDTSLWINHLRRGVPDIGFLLQEEQVVCHPFVVGELACGNLKNRGEILGLLNSLPQAPIVSHEETLRFIDHHNLMGAGLGWVDVSLLASALLGNLEIWTADRALQKAASGLNILHE